MNKYKVGDYVTIDCDRYSNARGFGMGQVCIVVGTATLPHAYFVMPEQPHRNPQLLHSAEMGCLFFSESELLPAVKPTETTENITMNTLDINQELGTAIRTIIEIEVKKATDILKLRMAEMQRDIERLQDRGESDDELIERKVHIILDERLDSAVELALENSAFVRSDDLSEEVTDIIRNNISFTVEVD